MNRDEIVGLIFFCFLANYLCLRMTLKGSLFSRMGDSFMSQFVLSLTLVLKLSFRSVYMVKSSSAGLIYLSSTIIGNLF